MKRTVTLSDKWADFLANQAETAMGYWIVSVLLHDGRRFDRVAIVGNVMTEICGLNEIPFEERDIAQINVTHDKWQFRSGSK